MSLACRSVHPGTHRAGWCDGAPCLGALAEGSVIGTQERCYGALSQNFYEQAVRPPAQDKGPRKPRFKQFIENLSTGFVLGAVFNKLVK